MGKASSKLKKKRKQSDGNMYFTWPRLGSLASSKTKPRQSEAVISEIGRRKAHKHLAIREWLRVLELEQYEGIFEKFDGVEELLEFTETDIKDLGVKIASHRARIMSSLTALRAKYNNNGFVKKEMPSRHSVAVDNQLKIQLPDTIREEEFDSGQKARDNGASTQSMSLGAGCENWDSSAGTIQGHQEAQQSTTNLPFQRQMRIGEKNLDLLAQLLDGFDEPAGAHNSIEDERPPVDADAPQKLVGQMIRQSKGLKATFTAEYHKQALIVKELKDALQIEEARLNAVVKGMQFLQKLEENLNSM